MLVQFDHMQYRKEFRETLDNNLLFGNIQSFFNHLFVNKCSERPLRERCYIVITRKGFSLWVAGMLCAMTGKKLLKPNTLISDRQWKLMTVEERNRFIKDRHVFVADDSVVTGAMSQSVYLEIEVGEGRAKSRSVAFLAADQNYSFDSMYQHYYTSDEVDVEKRRDINDKILQAMYHLSIPFTASSPVCHVQMLRSDFNALTERFTGKDDHSWSYEKRPIDLSNENQIETLGIFKAPINEIFGKNVLLRGMRVCYNSFAADGNMTVTFIPWIIFDAIDFAEAKKYLRYCITTYLPNSRRSWLYKQLECGEPGRVQTIIHRVVSYLYDCCVLAEFSNFLKEIDFLPFILPNSIRLEQYHFPPKLYEEMKVIEKAIAKDNNYPTLWLAMDAETHADLANNIYKTSYSRLEMPKTETKNNNIKDLENKLLKQREVTRDENDNPVFPSSTKKHPLICYNTERSLTVLDLIRRAIGSLRSEIISYKDKIYLINTLSPGEGSHLVFNNHLDFIYAYHQWMNSDKSLPGQEKSFVDSWNIAIKRWSETATEEDKNSFRFLPINTKTADVYFGTVGEANKERQLPIYDWPSEYAILKSKGIDLNNFKGEEKYCSYFKKIEDIVDSILCFTSQI